MVELKSMQLILPARDVREAARFYGEVLGFRVLSESPNHISLTHGNFGLGLIKAEPGPAPVTQHVQLRFTVSSAEEVDEIVARAKRLNVPVLEEVRLQADGTRTFTCLGPDEQIIEIATEFIKPRTGQEAAEAKPSTAGAAAAKPREQVQPPTIPPGRPTRSDRYLLEAQDRLAKIKEEMASLSTSFSHTDIAGTLEEMKQKVAQRVIDVAEKVAAPAEQQAERERKRLEAEEALARYKKAVAEEHQEPAAPVTPETEEEGLKPVRKTLGPSADDQEKTEDRG
jgi:catechol 2,3-dioxygenase-like lactoylglutathione lyase family enzyme